MAEVEIGRLGDFVGDDHRVVEVDGLEIGVFRLGKKLIAYKNECPHYGGPVCQGKIFNQTEELLGADKTSRGLRFSATRNIVCPWHGYEFNLETGCHPGDTSVRLQPIGVTVRDARVYLQVPDGNE
ncbi:MAG TPA: Rieske 2Fe-2S domain-containing protein [Stellaceae bacterium]|nr:Rieske 2Fe-2S domain-containing protein [Stellaceae bacterium]